MDEDINVIDSKWIINNAQGCEISLKVLRLRLPFRKIVTTFIRRKSRKILNDALFYKMFSS